MFLNAARDLLNEGRWRGGDGLARRDSVLSGASVSFKGDGGRGGRGDEAGRGEQSRTATTLVQACSRPQRWLPRVSPAEHCIGHVLTYRTSPDEQLLFAAKTDASDIVETIFTTLPPDEFDVNHQDGLGNTGE